ncbi:MAG: alpha/beta fold hydrolase [Gemmatimonadetes bacterium]|nr:alpha/beta fold hydrolase [Gemmatimonadota bacterium]
MARRLRALLGGAAAVALPAAFNARAARATPRLESRLGGDRSYYPWDQGYLFFAVEGEGPPLVLVHGVYPGASSDEWRKVFPSLSGSRRVYALDLLGFGLSDRPRITYDPPLYESLLGDFLQDVVGEPATLCASGLAGAFAVHTAFQRPAAVSGLVLVCPTGVYDASEPPRLTNFLLHRALRLPVLGLSAYLALTSRAGLERWLGERVYHDGGALAASLDGHHVVARQMGASYAIAAYLSGILDEPVDGIFGDLQPPVLLAWGRHSRLARVDSAGGFATLNPRAELEIFERSGALPQVEEAERFGEVVTAWLARAAARAPG